MSVIKLRAHHLLCLRGFKGKGYSPSFVKNFESILARVKQNPVIEIVEGGDEICSACPHFGNERCLKSASNDKKVKALDAKVRGRLNLSAGLKISYDKISHLVDEKIPVSKLREICGGCEWIEYCME